MYGLVCLLFFLNVIVFFYRSSYQQKDYHANPDPDFHLDTIEQMNIQFEAKRSRDLTEAQKRLLAKVAAQEEEILQLRQKLSVHQEKNLELEVLEARLNEEEEDAQGESLSPEMYVPLRSDQAIGDTPTASLRDSDADVKQKVDAILSRRYSGPISDSLLKAEPDFSQEVLYRHQLDEVAWKEEMDKLVESYRPVREARDGLSWPSDTAPEYGDITLVSGIWDLGRGNLAKEQGSQFHRKFQVYIDMFKVTVHYFSSTQSKKKGTSSKMKICIHQGFSWRFECLL